MKVKSPALIRGLQLSVSLFVIIVIAFTSFSFRGKDSIATIWSQLGISENTALENIKRSFLEGYLYSYGASAAKKVAINDRAAIANDVLNYSKQYVNSPEFRKEYEKARASSTPVKPADPKTKEEIQAERIASLNKSLEDGEKAMKTLPEDMKAAFLDVQQMLKDQIKEMEDPENDMLEMFVQGEKYNHQNAMQQYETAMSAWHKNFPEDPNLMIRNRLQKFLEVTSDVDYTAALKDEYGLKKFVNPVYERKPDEWKMAYRCGKPVVESARTFARQWLTELNAAR